MLDQIIIGIYLAALLFFGLYNRSKEAGIRNFGKIDLQTQKKTVLLLATIFTNSVGGGTVFGLAERVFSQNLSYVYAIAMTIIVDLMIAVYIVPRIARYYGVISVGEIMVKYYGNFGRIVTGLAASIVSFGYVAIQINVSSRIFQHLLHINYAEGVILGYLIIIIYTAIGGLRSVIATNLLQFFAVTLFIPIISIVGFYKIGFTNFVISLPVAKYYPINLWQDTLLLFLSFSCMGFHPGFIQRSFMTQDHKQTQKAIFFKSSVYLIFLIFIGINGLFSYIYYQGADSNLALLLLVDNIIPIGLKGMVILGFLSAAMSTADSELNIASISLINDVFTPLLGLNDSKIILFFTQIATLLVGSFAIFLAIKIDNTVDLILFVAGFWLPLVMVPLIGCLYDISIGNFGLASCAISGTIGFIYWQTNFADSTKLKSAFIGLLVNLICFTMIKSYQIIYNKFKTQP